MNINNFPVTQTYVANFYELAVFIEQSLFKYLKINTSDAEQAPKNSVRYPHVGLGLIASYISSLVAEFSINQTRQAPVPFEEVMMAYIKDEWHFVFDEEKKENVLNHDLFSQLRGLLLDVRTDVKVFLGSDHWVMHAVHPQSSDVYIYKGVDFRIADWTRRVEEGEWDAVSGPNYATVTPNQQALIDEKNHREREAKAKEEHLAQFGKI
jgi:hypothetical protein